MTEPSLENFLPLSFVVQYPDGRRLFQGFVEVFIDGKPYDPSYAQKVLALSEHHQRRGDLEKNFHFCDFMPGAYRSLRPGEYSVLIQLRKFGHYDEDYLWGSAKKAFGDTTLEHFGIKDSHNFNARLDNLLDSMWENEWADGTIQIVHRGALRKPGLLVSFHDRNLEGPHSDPTVKLVQYLIIPRMFQHLPQGELPGYWHAKKIHPQMIPLFFGMEDINIPEYISNRYIGAGKIWIPDDFKINRMVFHHFVTVTDTDDGRNVSRLAWVRPAPLQQKYTWSK